MELTEKSRAWLESAQEHPRMSWQMDIRGLTSGVASEMLRHGLIERDPSVPLTCYQMPVYRLTDAGKKHGA